MSGRCQRLVRRDGGETLIEALVTISIIGIAVVALLGAILTGVETSVLHRKQAQAQTELRSWAEKITQDPYAGCATADDFAGPGELPSGLSGAITDVKYWDGTSFGPSCGSDSGLQQVSLRMTVSPGIYPGFSTNLDVVVRKPCDPLC